MDGLAALPDEPLVPDDEPMDGLAALPDEPLVG